MCVYVCGSQGRMATYGINFLLLGRKGFGDGVRLLQVGEITMHPVYAAGIAVLFQLFHGLLGMLFLVREQQDLGGIVLEEVSDDAETDAGAAAGDDVDAAAEVGDVDVGVELVAREDGDHFRCGLRNWFEALFRGFECLGLGRWQIG